MYGVAELLPRCERLMLASRRAMMLLSAFKSVRLRSDVATWQQLVDKLYDSLDTTFVATHFRNKHRCVATTRLGREIGQRQRSTALQ